MSTTGHENEVINVQGLKASLQKFKDDKVDKVITNAYYHEGAFYEESTYTTEITGEEGKIYIDIPTNREYRWDGTQYVALGIDSPEKLGFGIGTCTTNASTVAKVVSITGFALKTNGSISVKFTNGITSANSTLNVSGTGAKPIYYNGSVLSADMIKNNDTVTMVYDGTNWNITSVVHRIITNDEWVDLGLPSGIKWATRNIDVTQASRFAASPYQYECSFFSWGNTDGHNPDINDGFDYNFTKETYDGTVGATLTGNLSLSYDAAHVNLGGNWRMPTREEFTELLDNTEFIDANGDAIDVSVADKRITYNNVIGIRLRSKNNSNEIFFPALGCGNGYSWYKLEENGYFWSMTEGYVNPNIHATLLYYNNTKVEPAMNSDKYRGYAVRPVQ